MSINWIPVKTSLPLMNCIVAVVVADGENVRWCQALYVKDAWFEPVCEELLSDEEVTHWALVELP